MSTGSRRLLVISAAGVAVLLLALAVAIALIDVNRYKPEIEEAVYRHTGRRLQLRGDLELSLFPVLAITLPASSLSARNSEAKFLSFTSAQVAIALLPLLRQEIVIDAIELRQARATLVWPLAEEGRRAPAAAGEASREAAGPAEAAPPTTPSASAEATSEASSKTDWQIGRLVLSDATITLRAAASGTEVTLSAINLETGHLSPKTRLPLALTAQLASNTRELAGKLDVTATVDLDLDNSTLAASDLRISFAGTLDKQALRAALNASRLSRQADTISAAQVIVHADGQRAAGAWTLAASAAQIAIDKQVLSSGAIEASVASTGAEVFEARIKLDNIAGSTSSLLAKDFLLTATRRAGPATMQVRVGGALSADIEQQTMTLPQLAGEIAVEDPQIPAGQASVVLSGAMALDARRETARLELAASEADASFAATIELKKFAALEIAFDLQAARLNLDRYLPPAADAEPGIPAHSKPESARWVTAITPGQAQAGAGAIILASAPAPAGATKTVDWSPLNKLRLDGTLQIAQLQARGIKAVAVLASVHSAAGRTVIAPVSASLYGGKANAELTLNAPAKRVALQLSLQDVDFGALARDGAAGGGRSGGSDGSDGSGLSGRGNVDLALSTAGQTLAERTRAAQGTARFALRDVALVGIDLSAVLGQVQAALSGGGVQSGKFDRSQRTVLSRLSGSIALADGIARNDDLAGAAPRLKLTGEGQFDLLAKQLDYTLRVAMTAERRLGSALLRALDGFPVPVHIRGPSEELRYSISLQDVAAEAIAQHGKDIGTKLVDEAERFLGRLFGDGKKK